MKCDFTFSNMFGKFSISILAAVAISVGIFLSSNYLTARNEISLDDALARINNKQVREVTFNGNQAILKIKSGNEISISELSESQGKYLFETVVSHNLANENIKLISTPASNPMDRIFQIIFILFFISPTLIVILLFMIWCELRKRNEHK